MSEEDNKDVDQVTYWVWLKSALQETILDLIFFFFFGFMGLVGCFDGVFCLILQRKKKEKTGLTNWVFLRQVSLFRLWIAMHVKSDQKVWPHHWRCQDEWLCFALLLLFLFINLLKLEKPATFLKYWNNKDARALLSLFHHNILRKSAIFSKQLSRCSWNRRLWFSSWRVCGCVVSLVGVMKSSDTFCNVILGMWLLRIAQTVMFCGQLVSNQLEQAVPYVSSFPGALCEIYECTSCLPHTLFRNSMSVPSIIHEAIFFLLHNLEQHHSCQMERLVSANSSSFVLLFSLQVNNGSFVFGHDAGTFSLLVWSPRLHLCQYHIGLANVFCFDLFKLTRFFFCAICCNNFHNKLKLPRVGQFVRGNLRLFCAKYQKTGANKAIPSSELLVCLFGRIV